MPRPLLEKVAIAIAVPVGLYAVILGLLLTPDAQRFALYAHKINTLFWQDIDNPTAFGFAKHQVTPFRLPTPDGETLYAWHVLPLDVYTRNEAALLDEKRPNAVVNNTTSTLAFRLLQDPDARVVISFHGNAGHVAQGHRPATYHLLAAQPNTHVLTIDYRGFGKSTGSPTEAGLISDATALIDCVLNVANIPPERIVLLGQSLGTAVASAAALSYADPTHDLFLPASLGKGEAGSARLSSKQRQPLTFAGVILVAPFSSLPSLLLTYRIGGILPILAPLRPFPALASYLTGQMIEKWPTMERLAAYYVTLNENPNLLQGAEGADGIRRRMGRLEILHAVNDADISYHQTEMITKRISRGLDQGRDWRGQDRVVDGRLVSSMWQVGVEERAKVRIEIVEHGGHNAIVTHTPVSAAVLRVFEDLD